MKLKKYWMTFRRRPLLVTYHLEPDATASWKAIRGIQIGEWFIGGVKGGFYKEQP